MQFLNSVYSVVKHSRPLIHNYRVAVSNDAPSYIFSRTSRAFSSRLDSEQEAILSSLPHKPKKPPGVWLRFIKEIEPQLIQKLPNAKRTELIAAASKMYNNADKEALLNLQKSYQKDMEQYNEDLKVYESKLTEEQREVLLKMKAIEKKDKARRELKKEVEALNKPKRPKNSYLLFNEKRRAEEPAIKNVAEWSKKMKNEWENLPEEEKNKYDAKAKELSEKYKVELSKWEASLENTEHSHLLKSKQPKTKSENTKSKPKSEKKVSPAQKGNVPQNKKQ